MSTLSISPKVTMNATHSDLELMKVNGDEAKMNGNGAGHDALDLAGLVSVVND